MHYSEERELHDENDNSNKLIINDEWVKKEYSNPFNWTGSKHRYIKDLFDVLPDQYGLKVLDPFVGGGDLISKLPQSWVISAGDSMEQIIDLHKSIQEKELTSKVIHDEFERRGLSKTNKDAYLELREEYNETKNIKLLYLLMTNSFNNQLRFNLSGGFNVPFGKGRTFNERMESKFNNYSGLLSNKQITFENKSYDDWDFNLFDLILVDPPYLNTTATYNESTGWNEGDDLLLFNKLDEVNENKKRFIYFNQLISNGKENKQFTEWSKKYNVKILKETTAGCSYNKKGGETIEVMVFN